MWRPGFTYEDAIPARLYGANRSLCVLSHTYRGTEQRPGLVLGLDHGGSCRGMAFRVAEENGESVVNYLRKRELDSTVYLEVRRSIRLERQSGAEVEALLYVVDRTHPQYAGDLSRAKALKIVRRAQGNSGANHDYVINTADHLAKLGIKDPMLNWLARRLRAPTV